ncbi:MAG: right-handed parallel beta-helix repeat-containing protein [Faecousia sp.]
MKRIIVFGVLLALVLGVLSGCGEAPEETIATAEPVQETEPQVTTMDEFLAAIGPDRTVTLAAGTYNLADAADYGRSGGSAWYRWEKVGDGYQLVLTGVDNLTIRGVGMEETILEADPRNANILVLEKCFRVTFEDFTAGHTQDPGFCSAGVVDLQASMGITFRRVGLYGCGCVGLSGSNCTDVQLLDSHIYDCSSSGVGLYRCDEVRIQNTKFSDIGDRNEGGYTVFSLSECRGTVISGCEITGAVTNELLDSYESFDLTLKKCRFTDNKISSCAFSLSSGGYAVMEDCMFGDNVIRRWYSRDNWSGGTFVDGQGQEITEAAMKKMYATVKPQGPLPEQTTVEAATVDELLAAIAPNTRIVLTGKTYDLSTADRDFYGTYTYWEEVGDGPELVISGVDNLTIESNDGVLTGHTITAVPRYANVLRFDNCTNLRLAGFTAGHTPEPGYCSGGVLRFDNCDTVAVENCGLYGCGVLGVWAVSCGDIQVKGCDIYECSWGGISLEYVSGASIENCTFRDLEGENIMVFESDEVLVDGQDFFGE